MGRLQCGCSGPAGRLVRCLRLRRSERGNQAEPLQYSWRVVVHGEASAAHLEMSRCRGCFSSRPYRPVVPEAVGRDGDPVRVTIEPDRGRIYDGSAHWSAARSSLPTRMPGLGAAMTFNIQNQNAGHISNVAGNQYNYGDQHATVVSLADAHTAARALLAAVHRVDLRPDLRDHLLNDAAAVEGAIAGGTPDQQEVAGRLDRITRALSQAGALVAAGASLVGPLITLGRWLGPAGAALLALLP
jgi:hypothetical protein